MSGPLIEFLNHPDFLDTFPKPYPASRAIPDWIRRMPAESGDGTGTVKRCQPFLDALTAGYIIPFPADMRITMLKEGEHIRVHLDMLNYPHPLVHAHPPDQLPGAPFSKHPLLKFINPWNIRTPEGYSCMFMAPVNRFDLPFIPLTGVVDTDVYYQNINFPAISLLAPGQPVEIRAGTPLVQVIPFKREPWIAEHRGWDVETRKRSEETMAANPQAYRELFWRRKTYA